MQQVQDKLDFKIDTPSDEELKRKFLEENPSDEELKQRLFSQRFKEFKPPLTKNQLKRQRKARRKAHKCTS